MNILLFLGVKLPNKSEDKYEAMRIIERIQTLSKPIELIAEDRRILHLK